MPMDLSDEEDQDVLNKSVQNGNQRYGIRIAKSTRFSRMAGVVIMDTRRSTRGTYPMMF